MAFFRLPLKIIVAVNVSVSYMVKSLNSQHVRIPAMESKRMKSTLLIIYNKGFCLRKTFWLLEVIGQKLTMYHYPIGEKLMYFPFCHTALPTWPFKDSPLISMRWTKLIIKTMKGMLHIHWSIWNELQYNKSSKWTPVPSYCYSHLFKDI